MSTFNADSKVLIIGAGPAGLALAQILRKHDVQYEIFERDERIFASQHNQGWTVALVEGYAELSKRIPDDIGDLKSLGVNAAVGNPDAIRLINGVTLDKLAKLGGGFPGEDGAMVRIDRQRLREFLAHKINVQTGKHFSHYTQDEEGVTAYFTDGTIATGAILVATDGAHSPVRSQLLSEAEWQSRPIITTTTGTDTSTTNNNTASRAIPPELSHMTAIMGGTTLKKADFTALYHDYASTGVIATAPGNKRLMIGLRHIESDWSTANYYWAICYKPADSATENTWIQHATKQDLYERSVGLTSEMHPFLTEFIRRTGVEGMTVHPPRFVEFVPPKTLPRGRVTLMGDAAHAMVPLAASGANTALRDACELGDLIVEAVAHSGGGDGGNSRTVDDVLHRYEKVMLPRGRDKVLLSRAMGEQEDGPMNLVFGRVHS